MTQKCLDSVPIAHEDMTVMTIEERRAWHSAMTVMMIEKRREFGPSLLGFSTLCPPHEKLSVAQSSIET
jgi:hypothetical protein